MRTPTRLRDLPLGYDNGGTVVNPNYAKALMLTCEAIDIHQGDESVVRMCPGCGASIPMTQGHAKVFSKTYCDPCVEKHIRDTKVKDMKKYWEKICPADYRDTDLKSEEFNHDAWNLVKEHPLDTNFVFLGESGQCKTRIACERIKRGILSDKTARIVFPDEIEDLSPMMRKIFMDDIGKPQILLLDDFLSVAGGSDQMQKFVFNVINKRAREKKTTIITTQITYEEWKNETEKFRNQTKAESERILAVIRRLDEKYVAINFDNPSEEKEEQRSFEGAF